MKRAIVKPKKPRKDFPLFPHATGRWAKKVRGRFVYFGKVDDDPEGEAALNQWLDQKDALLAGRTPQTVSPESLTVKDLVNRFLTTKRLDANSGDIAPQTFAAYYATCVRVLRVLGKTASVVALRADDFERLRADIDRTYNHLAARWRFNESVPCSSMRMIRS